MGRGGRRGDEAVPALVSHVLPLVPHSTSDQQVVEENALNGRRIRIPLLKRAVLNNLETSFDHPVLLVPYPLNQIVWVW